MQFQTTQVKLVPFRSLIAKDNQPDWMIYEKFDLKFSLNHNLTLLITLLDKTYTISTSQAYTNIAFRNLE